MSPALCLFADAGPGVGFGHVFRVYPVFCRLRAMGVFARMFVPLPDAELQRLGLKDVSSTHADVSNSILAILSTRPAAVLLDTYRGIPQWLDLLDNEGVHICVFDDHFRIDRPVMMIVNPSPAVSIENYGATLGANFLLGPAYASLPEGFTRARRPYVVCKRISRLLLALGGDDSNSNLQAYVRAAGAAFGDPIKLQVVGARPVTLEVPSHVDLNYCWLSQAQLLDRLQDTDLAMIAGGSMILHTICAGVPTICWPQTNKQALHAAAWQAVGAVVVIEALDELVSKISEIASQQSRRELSTVGQTLIDGYGASRIAECFVAISESSHAN